MGKFTGGRRRCNTKVLETAPIKSNSELEVDWLRWGHNGAWPDTLRYPPHVSTACRHYQADVGGLTLNGDFHYGEKEMRRQNPDTTWGLWFFLWLYRLFSGYGEQFRPPLLWAGLLFVLSTVGYMWWGLRLKDGSSNLAWTDPWVNPWDWLRAAHYSFQVMTLLKPDDWVPLRYAKVINRKDRLDWHRAPGSARTSCHCRYQCLGSSGGYRQSAGMARTREYFNYEII
jgi:hypothetical protein